MGYQCRSEGTQSQGLSGLPPAVMKEIEKLVCAAVEKGLPEQQTAEEVCQELKKKIKFLPEQPCEAEIEKVYDSVAAKCPKQEAVLPPAVMKEIEKLVCAAVEKALPEQKAAEEVCEALKKQIKFLPEQ